MFLLSALGEKGYQSQGLVFAAPGRCNLYQAGGDKGTVLLSPIKETVTGIKIEQVTKEPSPCHLMGVG